MSKYDEFLSACKEKKSSKKYWLLIYLIVTISMSMFHLYTAYFGILESWHQRSIHLGFVLIIAFLIPFINDKKEGERFKKLKFSVNLLLLVLAVSFFIYIILSYPDVVLRQGMSNSIDKLFSLILVILLLISSKRFIGWPLPIIAGIFLIYTFLGPYMPGVFRHGGFSVNKVTDQLFISLVGIFGPALGASAVYIVIFIIFGQFLVETKVGDFFIRFATSLTGKFIGGPAKTAVVASALMGTIHGSGPGNVATTGSFTIPLMKKLGYKPHFAGAVEAAASTGGIIMPPVMGATAFVMAEMTRIPYSRIMMAAAIPAVLYFAAVFFMVHLEALKENLKPIPSDQIPDFKKTVLSEGYMLIPIFCIIYFLLKGLSPMKSGLYAIIMLIIFSMFKKNTRIKFKGLIDALEQGATEIISIAVACGTAGIIAGLISLTGLGLKLSYFINSVSGNNLFIGLFMTMVVCIILGMGMPVTAAYILVAATTASTLTKMNISPLAAHMFIFYFATLSAITPPVALSSYTAAGIAGANYNKTGWTALKLALAAFIVPYMFVYGPTLLFEGGALSIIRSCITALIGVAALAVGVHGWHLKGKAHGAVRVVLLATALLLMDPTFITDLFGVAGVIVAVALQKILNKRHKYDKPEKLITG